MRFHWEEMYLQLLQDVVDYGHPRMTRAGETLSVWDYQIKFDLSSGLYPLLTTKKMNFRAIVGELLWFLAGASTIADLKHFTFGDREADKWTIWTPDAERFLGENYTDEGYLGPIYGMQWRCSPTKFIDQMKELIQGLKEDPYGRRHMVSAWNVDEIDEMCLPPCHYAFQCYVTNDGKLNLKWHQRSADVFLGVPYNIASYALLLHLLAKWTGYGVGELVGDLGDVHLYTAHLEAAKEQLRRNPRGFPSLLYIPENITLAAIDREEITAENFVALVQDYEPQAFIKAPLLVGS